LLAAVHSSSQHILVVCLAAHDADASAVEHARRGFGSRQGDDLVTAVKQPGQKR
jgi:hypothetical protein